MRSVNASALAEINREYGLEPITIVRVWWNDVPIDYSDKKEGSEVLGKVLEVSGFDNIISLDRSSASASISVKLDDSDGSLRNILNGQDIHKRPVQILQWFAGRPLSDAFVLFTGKINTPMVWSEGDRTLSFTVVNQIENLELGFSLEEGLFSAIPATAYGKSFPIVFGQVFRVPSLMLSESPAGITAQGFAYVFEDVYEEELSTLGAAMVLAFEQAQFLYQASIGAALLASGYNDGQPDPTDDYGTYTSLQQASQQYYAQYIDFMNQYRDLQAQINALNEDFELKKSYAFKQILIASENFPRGKPVIVEINGTRFSARFDGVVMTMAALIDPPDNPPVVRYFSKFLETSTAKVTQTQKANEKFRWFDAGSKIRVISVPLYYVACFGGFSQVQNVYARQKGVRVRIPNNLYTVTRIPFTNGLGHTVFATVITVLQPLTTLYDLEKNPLYESDEIWCDILGEVPGNFISILLWVITNFTTLTADADSFAAVAAQTVYNPMNFMLTDRKNTLDFIKELCYQARTAIWVEDNVVKLRYLPAAPTYGVTITPDDVLEGSLTITTDDTESLVTKTVATWQNMYDQEKPNKFIIRYNVAKYGLLEDETNYYAYHTAELVRRAASFWAIRRGNTWKKLTMQVHVGKLQLEAQDGVLLSGFNNMFSNGDVVGIVESAVFDSAAMTIALEIWLPIRWGEMDPFIWAYPADVTELFGFGLPEYYTGNPFAGATNQGFLDAVKDSFMSVGPQPPISTQPNTINDQQPTITTTTALSGMQLLYGRPSGFENANNRSDFELKNPAAVSIDTDPKYNADFGIVGPMNQDTLEYTVSLVGTDTAVQAKQYLIADGYRVPVGTPVYLVKKKGTWYMQSPVWAKGDADP